MKYKAGTNLKDSKNQLTVIEHLGTSKLDRLLEGDEIELSLEPPKKVLDLLDPITTNKKDKEK